jgi:hypothetical protein
MDITTVLTSVGQLLVSIGIFALLVNIGAAIKGMGEKM